MTSRQKEYLLVICEEGSISKAASRLNVSQPALSQCIQSIEQELGTTIFVKKHYPLSLTYAGERLIATIRKIEQLERNLHREVSDIIDEQIGRIRIGISALRGATFLPDVLPKFHKKNPGVEVQIIEHGSVMLSQLIVQDSVDIALLVGNAILNKDIVAQPVCIDQVYICAGPDSDIANTVESGTPLSIKCLEEAKMVMIKKGHGIHETQEKAFQHLVIAPRKEFEVDSAFLGMKLVLATNALMLCPASVLPVLRTKELCIYPVLEEYVSNTLYIGYSSSAYVTKYMQDFIRILKNTVRTKMKQPMAY